MGIEISEVASLPTKYENFKIQSFKQDYKEHLVIFKEPLQDTPIVRIHSECLTGDALGSLKCDCGAQLDFSLECIAKNGGMIIYLRQEGRDIGLLNKVNAYALQDNGLDTVEANHQLGFKDDERTYEMVEFILQHFSITRIQLLTNNPAKIDALQNVTIVKRLPIVTKNNIHNKDYLQIKRDKMKHLL